MNVLTISITEAGRAQARRLPYDNHHGDLVATVAARWREVDAFVLFCSTGIAVRAIARHLASKQVDPAVVCVDEAGRHAVSLIGGHAGANALASEVAALLDATPVITAGTDAAGLPALDTLPGFTAVGDVAAVTRAWLDGDAPGVESTLAWPLPFFLTGEPDGTPGENRVLVTDNDVAAGPGEVILRPASLVVGVGASTDAPADAATTLLAATLTSAGLHPDAVATVATIDRRAGDPALVALDRPVRSFTAQQLAAVDVPNPSPVVAAEVGTASVAEAAALLAAGPGAELVVTKQKNQYATLAIARRARPAGHLDVVGLGPGHPRHRTPQATAAVRAADVVIGYDVYVDLCEDLLQPRQRVIRSAIGQETERCDEALALAAEGNLVALVCSGDPGVFSMASLVLERSSAFGHPSVAVVPGVTASLAAAAALGAPLGHDHALISLSDLLTPWAAIETRLDAAAHADLVIALYNPRSKMRIQQFTEALAIVSRHRAQTTPIGIVTNATRPDQRIIRTTLGEIDPEDVGMFSMVIIGSSTTTVTGADGAALFTPRGYRP